VLDYYASLWACLNVWMYGCKLWWHLLYCKCFICIIIFVYTVQTPERCTLCSQTAHHLSASSSKITSHQSILIRVRVYCEDAEHPRKLRITCECADHIIYTCKCLTMDNVLIKSCHYILYPYISKYILLQILLMFTECAWCIAFSTILP